MMYLKEKVNYDYLSKYPEFGVMCQNIKHALPISVKFCTHSV